MDPDPINCAIWRFYVIQNNRNNSKPRNLVRQTIVQLSTTKILIMLLTKAS